MDIIAQVQAEILLGMIQASQYFGADGQWTTSKGVKIVAAIGAVIVGVGGAWLIVRGILDVINALKGNDKDMRLALQGVGVGIVGGVIIAAAFAGFNAFFKQAGQDFNVIN